MKRATGWIALGGFILLAVALVATCVAGLYAGLEAVLSY